MSNESQNTEFPFTQDNFRIIATSTFVSAFSDPFNWAMILTSLFFFVASGAAALFTFGLWLPTSLAVCVFIFSGWFLYRYIRAILNREIEISQDGIRYREASRRLFFEWDKIEKVKIEPHYKQITFWKANRLQRIHEFSLPRGELALVREVLVKQLVARNIQVRW